MNGIGQIWTLIWTFGLMSLFAVGGANSAIPEMHRIAVDVNHWMDDKQFADIFAISQLSPGPNVLIVTLIGYAVGMTPQKVGDQAGAQAGLLAPPWHKPKARRPAKEPLTADRIVAAAIEILDRDGLDAVTTRGVADALGTGSASLYAHVASRDELIEQAVRHFFDERQRAGQRLDSLRRIGQAVDDAGLYERVLIPREK